MTSKLTINLVVGFLGVIAVVAMILKERTLAGTALGALAGLLARTGSEPAPPTSTTNIVADTVESTGGIPPAG